MMPAPSDCMPLPRSCQRNASASGPQWLVWLPREWHEKAVVPLTFSEHHDYEVAAVRCRGYDAGGAACYYAHGYRLDEIRSDDDEEYYPVVVYSEAVHAWRLYDGRWLVHRIRHACGAGAPGRAVYTLCESCPG